MKKILFAALFILIAVCLQAQKSGSAGITVPKELVGHWQLGTFSMTSFWNPSTGQYAGNAGEASQSYQFSADGTMEEFFIYNSTSYNCRTQILGYRKGVIKLNADNSFSFCPTSGYSRTANCFKKDWAKKEYGSKDLCPTYKVSYYWEVQDGKLLVRETPGGSTNIYKKIDVVRKS